ncbi:unnamed protein product, partial [Phaeothamnion confervicola]
WSTSQLALSPEINVPVRFASTGTWYIWVRVNAPNSSGSELHVGLDGQTQILSSSIDTSTFGSWVWARSSSLLSARLSVATVGNHTLNVWGSEDGINVDRILLTTSSTFVPTGTGPAESARADVTAP